MTTPTEKKRLFTLAGDHWEEHAERVVCNNQWAHSMPSGVDVRSYFNAQSSTGAYAVVSVDEGPFNLAMRLDPANARALSKALLLAADRVDEVNAALVAEKAAAKLLAAKTKKAVAPATKTLSEVSP